MLYFKRQGSATYFEVCNKFSHLFMYFGQVMVTICFKSISLKNIGKFVLDHICDTIQYEDLSDTRHLREFYLREIIEILLRQAANLFCCLHLNVKAEIFAEMLENFKPGVDYRSDYFKIINHYYLDSLTLFVGLILVIFCSVLIISCSILLQTLG